MGLSQKVLVSVGTGAGGMGVGPNAVVLDATHADYNTVEKLKAFLKLPGNVSKGERRDGDGPHQRVCGGDVREPPCPLGQGNLGDRLSDTAALVKELRGQQAQEELHVWEYSKFQSMKFEKVADGEFRVLSQGAAYVHSKNWSTQPTVAGKIVTHVGFSFDAIEPIPASVTDLHDYFAEEQERPEMVTISRFRAPGAIAGRRWARLLVPGPTWAEWPGGMHFEEIVDNW